MAKVDKTKTDKMFRSLKQAMDDLPRVAHEEFIRNTPVRSGNARRNTRLQGTKIVADYAYSGELDAGRSPQAPQGMTQPTEQWIQQEVDRRLKDL
jgi:hypothetical protein